MQCALDGCDVEIEQPEKGPRRKFCCPAHRTAARSARLRAGVPLEAGAEQETVPATVGAAVEVSDDQPEDVELPAPRGSDDEPPVAAPATALDSEPAEVAPVGAPAGEEAVTDEPVAEEPVTDEPVADEPVGEEPAAITPPVTEPEPVARGRSLPTDAVAALPGRVVARSDEAPPALRRQPVPLRSVRKPQPIRGRAVVAAGLVVAMALGGGASVIGGVDDAPTGSVEAQSLPPAGARWATDARVALVSISRQIDDARAAEARWAETVGQQARQPREVAVLAERRMSLERTRMVLESQLSAWQNLQSSSAALGLAERQLQDFQSALQGPTTSAGRASTGQLEQQRLRLQGQVDRLRGQVASWDQDVQVAMTLPAPNPVDATAPLSRQVDDLVQQRREGRPEGQGSQPGTPGTEDPATLGREPSSGDPAIDLPGTSEPPQRGDDGVLAGAAPDAGRAVGDTARSTSDTVGDTARSAGGAVGDTARSAGDAVGGVAETGGDAVGEVAETGGDAVGDVADTAGDTLGGVTDSAGTLLSGGNDAPVESGSQDDEGGDSTGSGLLGVLDTGGDGSSSPQDGPGGDTGSAPQDPAGSLGAASPVSLVSGLGGGSPAAEEGPGSDDDAGTEGSTQRPADSAAAALRDAVGAARAGGDGAVVDDEGSAESSDDEADSGGSALQAAREATGQTSRDAARDSGSDDDTSSQAAGEEAREAARAAGEQARDQAQRTVERVRESISGAGGDPDESDGSDGSDGSDSSGDASSAVREAVSDAISRASAGDSEDDSSSDDSSSDDSSSDDSSSDDSSSDDSDGGESFASTVSRLAASSSSSGDDSSSGDSDDSDSSSSDSSSSDSSSSDSSSSDSSSSDSSDSNSGDSDSSDSDSGDSDSGDSDSGDSDSSSSDSGDSDSSSSDSGDSDSSSSDSGGDSGSSD